MAFSEKSNLICYVLNQRSEWSDWRRGQLYSEFAWGFLSGFFFFSNLVMVEMCHVDSKEEDIQGMEIYMETIVIIQA